MEFFKNIWAWIVENKEAILTFVTSTQFILFIKCILDMRKNKQAGVLNNKFLADLGIAFDTGVKKLENIDIVDELNEQRVAINNIAMAMMVAYSTIKDDAIRTEVTAYLNKAMNPTLLDNKVEDNDKDDNIDDAKDSENVQNTTIIVDKKSTETNTTASRC